MNIINIEEIMNGKEKQTVSGCAVLQTFMEKPLKSGDGCYGCGKLLAGGAIWYKAWNNSPAYNVLCKHNAEMLGSLCIVSGKISIYEDRRSLILDSITTTDETRCGHSALECYPQKYDAESIMSKISAILQRNCSPRAIDVVKIVVADPDVAASFTTEFAAIYFHDNVPSGLLAHTYKVLKLTETVSHLYDNVNTAVSPDLMFVGAVLHDVGKTLEYHGGTISQTGRMLSHNTLGIRILDKHKEEITYLMGRDFFDELTAIIAQHHGDHGDVPRTIASEVIFMVDSLDAKITVIDSLIEEGQMRSANPPQINFENRNLSYHYPATTENMENSADKRYRLNQGSTQSSARGNNQINTGDGASGFYGQGHYDASGRGFGSCEQNFYAAIDSCRQDQSGPRSDDPDYYFQTDPRFR